MLARALAQRALRLASHPSTRTSLLRPSSTLLTPTTLHSARFASHLHQPSIIGTRNLSSAGPSAADARIEEITERHPEAAGYTPGSIL